LSARIAKSDQPRRSAARDKLAPPAKYYRSGQLSDKAASPFKSQAKPPKAARRKVLFGLADIIVVTALVVGLAYSLLVKPDPEILANSSAYHPSSVYKQAAIKQFQLLKNRNKVSLDETGIVQSLERQFPEIAGASVELPLFGETPILHLDIAPPSFFLASAGKSYIVDQQGKVVAQSASLPEIKNLTEVIDQSGFTVIIGSQTLSASDVNFINTVAAEVNYAKIPIASLTLPSLAQEMDLRTTDCGYYVKFFLGGDPLLQSGQFLAARYNFDQSGSQPSQYLDVRVPGKIYYK